MMITAIGQGCTPRPLDRLRADAAQAAQRVKADGDGRPAATPTNPAADLAALGAPVDTDKVARLRAAIAGGSYAIDPQATAAKMIETDLPAALA